MTLATGVIFYPVVGFGRPAQSKRIFAYLLAFVLVAIAVYCLVIEVAVHQGSFVVMVVIVALRTRKLIKTRIKDALLKERMNHMARMGSSMSSQVLKWPCRAFFFIVLQWPL